MKFDSMEKESMSRVTNYREKVRSITASMTLREKISQMVHGARGISRLGIPAYNWWNECLHGVGRAGIATVFPQPIGLAAMFDEPFLKEIAETISDEVRAKYNEAVRQEGSIWFKVLKVLPDTISGWFLTRKYWYRGLTCWSPNINIFRDPRWGRGHETYGEDPYLTSRLGVAFVRGLQGEHPDYLKVVATPKHFAVHSGPEGQRHSFNAVVSRKDLYETYLPAFKACIQEAKAGSVMSAYNAVNGEPCSASIELLQKILREEWGFDGYVVSDCGAIHDIHTHHKKAKNYHTAAAMAVNAGCDLNCGGTFKFLKSAVSKGLVTEETLDRSVQRLFEARIRLGMFDSPEKVPYSTIGPEVIDCPAHRSLAFEAARRSVVLLKNDGLLPLNKGLNKLAVIGPNADSLTVLLGTYNGTPSAYTTALDGIRNHFAGETVYVRGCELTSDNRKGFAEAERIAKEADAIVLCLGLSPEIEGEEGDAFNSDASGDKLSLKLPAIQEELLELLAATGRPLIVALFAGSPLDLREVDQLANAVILAWYPGQDGGKALAEILLGDFNPSGRLPVTFVRSDEDLPPFEDYSMKGRTYRYLEKPSLYPFGFGLSYTAFEYANFELDDGVDGINASVLVKNTGAYSGGEVVQFYLKRHDATVQVPNFQLCGFKWIELAPGESAQVAVTIPRAMLEVICEDGISRREPGRITIYTGGQQPDVRSEELTRKRVLAREYRLF
jgi:beta-glucosidase